MSWYRTGTVAVTNGSKTVTGVGTLFTTAVNVGDAFALVDANLNPTGAWYEVEAVVSNTEITLKQSYAGTTGSNNQYCVFNLVGNMTTPSFAQRLATFFASFQTLLDKPTSTPTALGIPIADENGNIANGWISKALLESNDAMVFKGTLGTGGTVTALPTSDYVRGWTYKVITAGTYAGLTCAIGDLIVAISSFVTEFQNSDWVLVPVSDEMTLKADITYVDAGLALKANTTDVDDALALKADVAAIQIANRVYGGVDLTTKFAAEIAEYDDAWAWIKARVTNVNYAGLNIGDYIPFTLGAETIWAQIAGIDTYYRTGDSEIGHHIDFISKDCLTQAYQWNTTNTNNGTAVNAAPWMVSALKASLDGLVSSLPAGLQSVVIEKRAYLECRYSDSGTLVNAIDSAWNNMGKLWIPTEFEVFGALIRSSYSPYAAGQALQYPIFANSNKSRIKGERHNMAGTAWWLASAVGGYSNYICAVNSSGTHYLFGASVYRCVPICFRIG